MVNNLDGAFVKVCATTPVINTVKDSAEQSHTYGITIHSTFPVCSTHYDLNLFLMHLAYYSHTLNNYNLVFYFKLCILKQSHIYILYCFSLSWGQQKLTKKRHKKFLIVGAQCPTPYYQFMTNQEVKEN